jgi:dihydrofolate reductase
MERNDLVVCRSLPEAIEKAKNEDNGEIFIIGGGEIYKIAMDIADKIYLTVVDQVVDDADTFFPEINQSLWEVQEKESVGYGERLVLRRK